jgi:hypothetical protein
MFSSVRSYVRVRVRDLVMRDPKTQPEFLYRRGSLVQLSENCLAAHSTEVKLVSFVARRVVGEEPNESGRGQMLGFGFGCDF